MSSTSSPDDPQVLDAGALERLRELDPDGRNGIVERVLGAFDGSLVRMQAQFRQALADGDDRAVATLAHTLKSSSASVGALALSSCCAAAERAVRDGRHDEVAALTQRLLEESERALSAVRAMLAR